MPITLADSNFKSDVLDYEGVVFVDLWAPWCAPCRMLSPIVEELAQDYAGKAKITKLNVDDNPATAQELGVMGIPTMVIFKDGEEVDRLVGVMPKNLITERLDKWIP